VAHTWGSAQNNLTGSLLTSGGPERERSRFAIPRDCTAVHEERLMAIQDILVLVDKASQAAGPYALSLAARLGAHLTAVTLVSEHSRAGPFRELPHNLLAAMYDDSCREAKEALEPFERAEMSGVDTELIIVPASQTAEGRFRWLARHFDLTIAQQSAHEGPVNDFMLEAVLFGSGRPVLFVPHGQVAQAQLRTILIAWDESATVARAIGDALPLLRMADHVELVTVAEARSGQSDNPSTRMIHHLARHGIAANVMTLPFAGGVTDTLLSQAADIGADLLVMGGYGHSRLRELVLGGTTRTMLASMTVPTLMAH
jgi:nucleotide-binding universal stress UspA family protein